MFNFEKLEVWHKAIAFADRVYDLTIGFPGNQMRRAAVSICSNIARGTSRRSSMDDARLIELATGSPLGVISQATISVGRKFFNDPQYPEIYASVGEPSRMPSGLRASILGCLRGDQAPLDSQLPSLNSPHP